MVLKIEIRQLKDDSEIDVEDEDWSANEAEHRENAINGMAALAVGLLLTAVMDLILVACIDSIAVIPPEYVPHFEKFKILLPMGCVLVASIVWMFHEKPTETRELAVFSAALVLALLTMIHVVALRLVRNSRIRVVA